jgi:16S rRNA (adenine1518-N6/adenine1519-N6)-dimethyltransferase
MMQQKDIRYKKSLGQHFLQDPRAIQRIVKSLNLTSDDVVLEIGCGQGALTGHILGKVRDYIGVEIDKALYERLLTRGGPHAHFVNQDILKLKLEPLGQRFLPDEGRFKIVGNLPYYISSPIIQYLAHYSSLLQLAVIMVQAEVADRLTASPSTKSYGVLTLLAQYHFRIRELFIISPGAFRPVPQVFSKVLALVPIEVKPLQTDQEAGFFQFVKQAFSQRRKTFLNSMKGLSYCGRQPLGDLLQSLGYPTDIRAEAVRLEDFVSLYHSLNG